MLSNGGALLLHGPSQRMKVSLEPCLLQEVIVWVRVEAASDVEIEKALSGWCNEENVRGESRSRT